MNRPEPADFSVGEHRLGLSAEFTRTVNQEDVDRFVHAAGDFNPLHTDLFHAAKTEFWGRSFTEHSRSARRPRRLS